MEPRQTQGTMLLTGVLSSTVAFVAFVAMMVIGELSFAAAVGIAAVIFLAVAIVLVIGLHKPEQSDNDA